MLLQLLPKVNQNAHAYWFSYAEHVSSVVHKKF